MSDTTVRASKQTSKELGHIAIDADVDKKELLRIIAENLKYDEDQQKIRLETKI